MILADGTVQLGENEPVTNRFGRTVQVKDGGLDYSGARERGTLMLHETAGRRMLVGRISPIEGRPYAVYLEAQALASTATAALPVVTPSATAPAPAQSPAPAGLVTGTYRGTVSGEQRGRPYSAQFTTTLAQQGDEITGTWLTVGGASGTVRGRLLSPTRVELRIEQLHPCPAQFTGAATIGEGGASLGGSYSGPGCNGPVSTSFTVIRQP